MKIKLVSSSVASTECLLPVRFCGGECDLMENCKRPGKPTCKAYQIRTRSIVTHEQHCADGRIKLLD